jgi:hypothetical protein
MWGASNELTAIMRRSDKDSVVTRDTIELLILDAQFTVWSRDEGKPFPNLNDEPDPDDLYPDDALTKTFLKQRYEAYFYAFTG